MTFSSIILTFVSKYFSKIVVRKLKTMFMAIFVSKIYPVCHTDDNGIKQGSNLTSADKRFAAHSEAEKYGINDLYVMFKLLIHECFKNIKCSW